RKPLDLSRRPTASRTASSSSTTNTVESAVIDDAPLGRWQGEVKRGPFAAGARVRPQPATVGVYDRPTNRQAYPHAVCLRRHEGFKESVCHRGRYAGPRIDNRDLHGVLLVQGRRNVHFASAHVRVGDRLHAVPHKI